MRTALAVSAAPLAKLLDRARDYAADGRAGSTKRAYLSDFRSFEAWCASQGVAAMPARPELVALYATAMADSGRRVSTIERAVTAIAQVHRSQGIDWPRSHPALTEVLAGIRRRLGTAPEQKAPVVDQKLVVLLEHAGEGLMGDRNRALLALGWFGAFRRAELVSLDAGDVVRGDEGLVVTLRRSKGDQEGHGATKGILTRPSRPSAPCARSRAGSRPPASPKGQSSAGSTVTGTSRRSVCTPAASRAS